MSSLRDRREIFKVFLCSTYSDLIEERQAVLDTIRRLQLLYDSMEFFGARPGRPLDTVLQEVKASNIVIVIIGHRYGTIVPGRKNSYTELEYKEAWRNRKPCLVYFRSDDMPILPSKMERTPAGISALDRFKRLLLKRHHIAVFRQADDLAVQVAIDIQRTLETIEQQDESKLPKPELIESTLSLLDFLNTASFFCDMNDCISNVNQCMANALGYPVSDLVGRTLKEMCDATYSYRWSESGVAATVESGLYKTILPLLHKDGFTRWFELDVRKHEISDEGIIQCIARDVTERIRAEQALMESEDRYREIAESLPAVLMVVDAQLNVLFANELAVFFFGYANQADMLGHSIARIEEGKYETCQLYNAVGEFIEKGTQQKLLFFRQGGGVVRKLLVHLNKAKHGFRDREKSCYFLVGLIDPNLEH